MAAGKENEAPAAPSAAARRNGVAVRTRGLKKRPGGKRWPCRVPLRDITNLVAAAELEALPGLEDPDQVTWLDSALPSSTAVRDVVAKAARFSLRKEFR